MGRDFAIGEGSFLCVLSSWGERLCEGETPKVATATASNAAEGMGVKEGGAS